jgi:hypothetical protein
MTSKVLFYIIRGKGTGVIIPDGGRKPDRIQVGKEEIIECIKVEGRKEVKKGRNKEGKYKIKASSVVRIS